MEEVYPEHISVRRHPKNMTEADSILFKNEFSRKIDAVHVHVLCDSEILGDTIFDLKRREFYAHFTHAQGMSFSEKLERLWKLTKRPQIISKGIWITDNWSHGYFHWFGDALPRLMAAEKYWTTHPVLLPARYATISFIMDSLKSFGVEILFFDQDKRYKVNELVLPAYAAITGNYNEAYLFRIREKLVHEVLSPTKKIYISRQQAAKRRITNEDEVVALLKNFDFEIHCFENYKLEEQVRLMQQATHLIGLHGSGLTNMLFMNKNGTVLELRNAKDSHNNCYFTMASAMEHDYYYLINKGESADTTNANVTVNVPELKNILERMFKK